MLCFPSISTMLVACHCHPLVIKTPPWRITQLKIAYVMCLLKVAFFHCTIRLPEGIPYIHQNPQFGKPFCIKVPVCSSMYLHTILHDTPGISVIYIYMCIYILIISIYISIIMVAVIVVPQFSAQFQCCHHRQATHASVDSSFSAHPTIRILSR